MISHPLFPRTPEQRDYHGYVAGRYRDGALSDGWTDVTHCAKRTFIGYVPACSCGWTGSGQTATIDGYVVCQRARLTGHFANLSGGRLLHVVGEPAPSRVAAMKPRGRLR